MRGTRLPRDHFDSADFVMVIVALLQPNGSKSASAEKMIPPPFLLSRSTHSGVEYLV
jgi:hypothetical protein